MVVRFTFVVLAVALAALPVAADDASLTEDQHQLFSEATEVLTRYCLKCHAGESAKSELDLTTRAGILAGGEQGGPAYDEESPEDSGLLMAVRFESFEMPPTGQIAPKHIEVLEQWVKQGMPWPAEHAQLEFEHEPGPPVVNEETKQFWSFQPVHQPPVPSSQWGHNPIDAFINSRLEQNKLTPSPVADAKVLVRRMHYDITGLPPEPQLVSEWSSKLQAADGTINQNAVRDLVETLLESPHYGEHWGRHWLDLVRYAETNSYERDGAKPHVWRYRDYVIRAFNTDKPYDHFLKEQLAGDELDDATADSIIATGYYRLGRWDDEPADRELALFDDIDDIVSTTSQTMLGLTVNCARCHDHKIDPIPQRDYYRMVAFFRNVRRYGQRNDKSVEAASVREVNLEQDGSVLARELKHHQEQVAAVRTLIEKAEQEVIPLLSEPQKEDFQFEESRLSVILKLKDKGLSRAQVDHYRNLRKRLKKLNDAAPNGRAKALCVTEDLTQQPPTYILTRGNPHAPADEVTPGFPAVLSPPEVAMPDVPEGAVSSGRRTVLANWITDPTNPLTARVMVNRVWQYHFGRGIVKSSSDFGFQGTEPTHPLLLDWLASQFVSNGWSVKHLHRLIMTSATYQMASAPRPDAYEIDPLNDLFWRFDMRRLSAEEIRDSILWATGSLNAKKMFGPSIYTDIPDEVKAGQSRPGSGWGKSSPEDRNRRSVYIHVKRSLVDPLLESFDFADTDQTCPVRFATTQPTQALSLLNSKFMLEQAEILAAMLRQEGGRADQVRQGLLRVTQREPTADEIEQGVTLIEQLQSEDGLSADQALQYFCLVSLNLNEFIYLD